MADSDLNTDYRNALEIRRAVRQYRFILFVAIPLASATSGVVVLVLWNLISGGKTLDQCALPTIFLVDPFNRRTGTLAAGAAFILLGALMGLANAAIHHGSFFRLPILWAFSWGPFAAAVILIAPIPRASVLDEFPTRPPDLICLIVLTVIRMVMVSQFAYWFNPQVTECAEDAALADQNTGSSQ